MSERCQQITWNETVHTKWAPLLIVTELSRLPRFACFHSSAKSLGCRNGKRLPPAVQWYFAGFRPCSCESVSARALAPMVHTTVGMIYINWMGSSRIVAETFRASRWPIKSRWIIIINTYSVVICARDRSIKRNKLLPPKMPEFRCQSQFFFLWGAAIYGLSAFSSISMAESVAFGVVVCVRIFCKIRHDLDAIQR